MYDRHRTKEGSEMLICQMTDRHLVNFINLMCRQITAAREVSEGMRPAISFVSAVMMDLDDASLMDQARITIQQATRRLYPYLAEAFLRGIGGDLLEIVRKAFGRSTAETQTAALPVRLSGKVRASLSLPETEDDPTDADWWDAP